MSTKCKHPHSAYNGEPGCQTLAEVNKMFRNIYDPTSYWQCDRQGGSATLRRCPASELFMEARGGCVPYTEWEWTEPMEPPSRRADSIKG